MIILTLSALERKNVLVSLLTSRSHRNSDEGILSKKKEVEGQAASVEGTSRQIVRLGPFFGLMEWGGEKSGEMGTGQSLADVGESH